MAVIATAFVFSMLFYLLLTAGSGNIGIWSLPELAFAVGFSAVLALVAKKIFTKLGITPTRKLLNPKRWALLLVYAVGPFLFSMAKANLDVAYRVVTGKIRPGIVKVETGLKSHLATTVLANSITLTPGTLTIDLDEKGNLYVHWIYVKSKKPRPEEVCGNFVKWAGRIAE
ncbi:MAG: Na+/H+ antiporter subunit E [Candidatus Diapherotrites archaeon]|uniref:Na+/H+ antiporter subunit E n=1 Tax=Candidatus Iainarchaeum sp. TaxID=3101447 RepID=A0A938YWL2_9ARCH|nr:Na+/H+ antiporter subunit E [Candidatus Diapherotrites archaeon]